ncbi:BON domain-containing protein [Almyronema epifaneia]|uniref:BON domain-containing protein n=1 Tax=Almyronema epifaneia S1 TaxID=2991925 RepID=A0ABW6II43_9CYAN
MGAYEAAYTSGQIAVGIRAGTSVAPMPGLSWYRAIPPERVGLRGEYDHQGLAKRVQQHFRRRFKAEVAGISVRQRGRVVILRGQVASEALIDQLVRTAMQIEGADAVELHGVTVQPQK